MSRIINPNSSGKLRRQLIHSVVLSTRELSKERGCSEKALDLMAFIVFALQAVSNTVETSTKAWEKRGYWLKADRFRNEWEWADALSSALRKALLEKDWLRARRIISQISDKLSEVEVPQRHRMGSPWVGSWMKLVEELRKGEAVQQDTCRREG